MIQTLVNAAHALTSRIGPCRRWPNRLRRALLPRLDGLARRRGRPLVRDKTRDTAEFVVGLDASVCDIERALSGAGFRRNVLATLKYREGKSEGRRYYETASWALHDGRVQYHVYLFEMDHTVAVYAHRETSYLFDAAGHQGHGDDGVYAPGDPDGVVAAAVAGVGERE